MRIAACALMISLGSVGLLTVSSRAAEITVVDQTTGAAVGALTAVELDAGTFFPVNELTKFAVPVKNRHYGKRAEMTVGVHHITVAAFTPFVQIDNRRLQMTHDVVMQNGELLLPAAEWANAMTAAGAGPITFDTSSKRLSLPLLTANIISLQAEPSTEGVLFTLACTKQFFQTDISAQSDKERIYLNVKSGIFQSAGQLLKSPIPEIFELIPEYLRESSRLAIHVAPGISLESVEALPNEKKIRVRLIKSAHNNTAILHELAQERQRWRIDKIIIDPGHGGKDPGCVGPDQIYEKNITLAIARSLKEEIRRSTDAEVIMTREDDTFVPLKMRTQAANQASGKLFISIHVDANHVKSLRGHTIYFMGPAKTDAAREAAQFENSVVRFEESQKAYEGLSDAAFILAANAQNSFNKESQDLAAMVDEEITRTSGSSGHGVRQAGFFVLYGASMPNILIETGFMTNTSDRRNLSNSTFQKSLARAICSAVIKFKERYEGQTF